MLFEKMRHDIRKNIVSFFAIFAMAFISLTFFSGLAVVNNAYIKKYIDDSNYRDLDVTGDCFSEDDIGLIKDINGVVSAEGYYNTSGKIIRDQDEVKLRISYISGNDISMIYISEGEAYAQGKEGVWLEKNMCDAKGIHIGDICQIETEGNTIFQEVKGTVYSPQYLYYVVDSTFAEPIYSEYGFAFMDESQLVGKGTHYNQLLVDTKEGGAGISLTRSEKKYLSQIKEAIKNRLENEALTITDREQDPQLKSYRADIRTENAIGFLFSAIFSCITILGIVSTMSRLILKQRTDIGTLKAFGYTDIQIILHYISYSFFIVLVASILGAVIGYTMLGDIAISNFTDYYLNPYEGKYLSGTIYGHIILLLLVAVGVTYVSIRRVLSEPTAFILRPEVHAHAKKSWYEHIRWWKKVRFATQWNVRDIATHPIRTTMSLLAITTCSALIFASVSYIRCLGYQEEWSYDTLLKARYRIEFAGDTGYGTVYDYSKEYDGQMVEKKPVSIHSDKTLSGYFLTVVDKGNNFFLNGRDGQYIPFPDNGLILSRKVVDVMKLPINSIIDFNLPGDKKVYSDRVVAVNSIPYSQGIIMTRDHYESLEGSFQPNFLYTRKAVPKSLEDNDEIISVMSIDELRQGIKSAVKSNYTIAIIMFMFALALGTVMMLNMGVMSYNEKIRDMAVLKVLGFSTIDLKILLMQQNFYITFIGYVIGAFLGIPVLKLLFVISGDTIDFMSLPSATPYIIDMGVTFILSVLINMHIISGVENVDMVSELKDET